MRNYAYCNLQLPARVFVAINSKNNILALFFCLFSGWLFGQDQVDFQFQMEHTKPVNSIAFSKDRRLAATGSDDRIIKIWDVATHKLIKTLKGHDREVAVVKFSPDSRYLFSAEKGLVRGGAYEIRKWDIEAGKLDTRSEVGTVKDILVSPEGKYLLLKIGGHLWTKYEIRNAKDLSINKELSDFLSKNAYEKRFARKLMKSHSLELNQLEWGMNDRFIAVYGKKKLWIWDLENEKEPTIIEIKPGFQVTGISFINSDWMVLGGSKGQLVYQSIKNGKGKYPLEQKHKYPITNIYFMATTQQLVTQSIDGLTSIWEREGIKWVLKKEKKLDESITILQEHIQDKNKLITANSNGTIKIWDKQTGKVIKVQTKHQEPITKMMPISFLGNNLVLSYSKDKLQLWKLYNGKLVEKQKQRRNKKIKVSRLSPLGRHRLKIKLKRRLISIAKPKKNYKKLKLIIGRDHLTNHALPLELNEKKSTIALFSEEGIKIWDFKSDKEITLTNRPNQLNIKAKFYEDLNCAPNDSTKNFMATFDLQDQMYFWDLAQPNYPIDSTPTVHALDWVTTFHELDKMKYITGSHQGIIKVWDLNRLKLSQTFNAGIGAITDLDQHNETGLLAVIGEADSVKFWGLNDNLDYQKHSAFPILGRPHILKFFTGKHQQLLIGTNNRRLYSYQFRNGRKVWKKMWDMETMAKVNAINMHENRKRVAIAQANGRFNVLKRKRKYRLKKLRFKGISRDINKYKRTTGHSNFFANSTFKGVSKMVFMPNGKKRAFYFAENNSNMLADAMIVLPETKADFRICYGKRGKRFKSGHKDEITGLDISQNGNYLISASKDRTIKIWNTKTRDTIQTLYGHKAPITTLQFSEDMAFIYSADQDNRLKVWNFDGKETKLLVTIVGKTQDDFFIYSPDTLYHSSRGSGENIHFILNDTSIYYFDQFDHLYNRPDLILEKINPKNKELIRGLHKAHKKRLEKMGIQKEQALSYDFHLPDLKIRDKYCLDWEAEDSLQLYFTAKDTLHPIHRVKLWVNNVPILGEYGQLINPVCSLEAYINVPLTQGINKIQLSVVDTAFYESLRETVIVENKKKHLPDLYLITIGVADFLDNDKNLNYPVKDAKDIEALFLKQNSRFQHVYKQQLLEKEVSLKNIQQLKYFLSNTKVDDQVVVFISNHGILDSSLNYFFATYNMDFKNPAATGIPFESLNDLLTAIPARNKLLLIDACHAGEVDKENFHKTPDALDNSFDMMHRYFADLRRGSGTSIIAGSKANESAIDGQGKLFPNGLFTFYLLKSFQDTKADGNKDGQINLSELQKYLAEKVKARREMQNPVFRQRNLANDFVISNQRLVDTPSLNIHDFATLDSSLAVNGVDIHTTFISRCNERDPIFSTFLDSLTWNQFFVTIPPRQIKLRRPKLVIDTLPKSIFFIVNEPDSINLEKNNPLELCFEIEAGLSNKRFISRKKYVFVQKRIHITSNWTYLKNFSIIIPSGIVVEAIRPNQNISWFQIKYERKRLWVKKDYLDFATSICPLGKALRRLKVYQYPSTKPKKIAKLPKGTTFRVMLHPKNGSYTKVQLIGSKLEGWVLNKHIELINLNNSDEKIETPTLDTIKANPINYQPNKFYSIHPNSNIKEAPDALSNIVASLTSPQFVQIIPDSTNGLWQKIRLYPSGKPCWIEISALGTTPKDSIQLMVQRRTSLRTKNHYKSSIIHRVAAGDRITILGASDNKAWSKAIYKDSIGWIRNATLIINQSKHPKAKPIHTTSFYKDAKTFDVLQALKPSDIFLLLPDTDNGYWTKVQLQDSSRIGWVRNSDILIFVSD